MENYKQERSKIDERYNKLIESLQTSRQEIKKYYSEESKFSSIQNAFIEQLDSAVQVAKDKFEEVRTKIVWDRLVIAFFGETGAGKSTIIETFRILFGDGGRGLDGEIVGDGRSDYTQVYAKYDMSINGHPFTLIDVPGIEGKESDYQNEIKEALMQAHCVFYVQGHNKEPDVKTAEKIKMYLNDWVKVYSVYNVRGSVENYDEDDERENLYTQSVNKQIGYTTSRFSSILGACYQGNITLQALIAMCSNARFTPQRPDLIKQQKRLLSLFGSSESALKFSRFEEITQTVQYMSTNFREYILEANNQKFQACVHTISKRLNSCSESNSVGIKTLCKQLNDFKSRVSSDISNCKDSISKSVSNTIDVELNNVSRMLCASIENEESDLDKKAKYLGEDCARVLTQSIPGLVRQHLNDLKRNIDKRKKDLHKNINLNIQISGTHANFSMDSRNLFECLDLDFSDWFNFGSFVVSGASIGSCFTFIAPGVATAVGALIGAILGGINYIFSSKKGKKAKAKTKVIQEIEKLQKDSKYQINKELHPIFKELENCKGKMQKQISNDVRHLHDMEVCFDDLNMQLKTIIIKNL